MFNWFKKKKKKEAWYDHYLGSNVLDSSDKLFLDLYEEYEFSQATIGVCGDKLIKMKKIYLKDGIDLLIGDKVPEDFYFDHISIPKRDPNDVAKAKPSEGDHKTQVENATKKSFERYEDAYKKLADK